MPPAAPPVEVVEVSDENQAAVDDSLQQGPSSASTDGIVPVPAGGTVVMSPEIICSICQQHLSSFIAFWLPCCHCFHVFCIKRWWDTSKKYLCPICKLDCSSALGNPSNWLQNVRDGTLPTGESFVEDGQSPHPNDGAFTTPSSAADHSASTAADEAASTAAEHSASRAEIQSAPPSDAQPASTADTVSADHPEDEPVAASTAAAHSASTAEIQSAPPDDAQPASTAGTVSADHPEDEPVSPAASTCSSAAQGVARRIKKKTPVDKAK